MRTRALLTPLVSLATHLELDRPLPNWGVLLLRYALAVAAGFLLYPDAGGVRVLGGALVFVLFVTSRDLRRGRSASEGSR